MNFFKKLFQRQPKIWAISDREGVWHKVVAYGRPVCPYVLTGIIGPMRSEMDAEEFCDRANKAKINIIKLYLDDVPKQEQPNE